MIRNNKKLSNILSLMPLAMLVIGQPLQADPRSLSAAPGSDAGQTVAPVRWTLPAELELDAKQITGHGLAIEKRPAGERIAPLIVIAGAAALIYVVHAAVQIYKDVRYGGIIMTIKDGKVLVSNDPRIPGGLIIVRNGDNLEVLRTDDSNQGEVVEKLAALLK